MKFQKSSAPRDAGSIRERNFLLISSAEQQGWLRFFESVIEVNPNGIAASSPGFPNPGKRKTAPEVNAVSVASSDFLEDYRLSIDPTQVDDGVHISTVDELKGMELTVPQLEVDSEGLVG